MIAGPPHPSDMEFATTAINVATASAPRTAFDENLETEEEVVDLTEEIEAAEAAGPVADGPVELVEEIDEAPAMVAETEGGIEREFEIDHSLEEDGGKIAVAATPTGGGARLAAGQQQEILIPIELEAGGGVRRFTLSIRIQLKDSTLGN